MIDGEEETSREAERGFRSYFRAQAPTRIGE